MSCIVTPKRGRHVHIADWGQWSTIAPRVHERRKWSSGGLASSASRLVGKQLRDARQDVHSTVVIAVHRGTPGDAIARYMTLCQHTQHTFHTWHKGTANSETPDSAGTLGTFNSFGTSGTRER